MKRRILITLLLMIILIIIFPHFSLDAANNYTIATEQQFIDYLLNETADMEGSYILINDLDFTSGTVNYQGSTHQLDKGGLIVAPIGEKKNEFGVIKNSFYNPFKGTFNGGGHVIKGLNIRSKADDNEYVGLFGYNQGIISNLGLVDSTVDGGIHVGGIAGYNIGTILGCYNTSSITGIGTVGGITGINYGYVRNCYNTGYVGGATKIGGIVGHNSSVISAVYDLGIISGEFSEDGTKEFGYIFGYNNSQGVIGYLEDDNGPFTFGNSLQKYSIAGAYYSNEYDFGVGYNVGYSKDGIDKFDNVNITGKTLNELKDINNYDEGFKTAKNNIKPINSSYIHKTTGFITLATVNNPYPFPVVGTSESTALKHVENSIHKNGYSGAGTIYNPYIVVDEIGLNNVRNSLTSAYKLGNNIKLTQPFLPIGDENNRFRGIFIGNGKRISNVNINLLDTQNYIGLFAFNSGIIHNLSVDVNINTPNSSKVGAIAGFNNGQIIESYVRGTILGLNTVGGLVGSNDTGIIKNSFNLASITGGMDIGGISGYNSGIIEFVYSTKVPTFVDINTGKNLGGIVGYNENIDTIGYVEKALHIATNQIGYQTSVNGPYNAPNSSFNSISEFGNINNFLPDFNISSVLSGALSTTIWTIEPGVNEGLAFLTNTPPIRVESLELDTNKQLEVNGDNIRIFDENGNIILSNGGFSLDLNEFLIINPKDAENQKVNWQIISQNPTSGSGDVVTLDGSIVTSGLQGSAIIRVISEDGSKTLDINVLVVQKVNTIEIVDENSIAIPNTKVIENYTSEKLFVQVLPTNANNKNVIWESSDTKIASVDENGIVTVHYIKDINNPVINGNYSNSVTVKIKATSIENNLITDEVTLIITPSKKTNLENDFEVIENGLIIPLEKNQNIYNLINNQYVKFNTDFIELKINTKYNQTYEIKSEQAFINENKIYLSKGTIDNNEYINRNNAIDINIIAENGDVQTYILNVTKSLSNVTDVKELNVSIDGINKLNYTYLNNKFTITDKLPHGTEYLYFEPTLDDTTSIYSLSKLHQFSFMGSDGNFSQDFAKLSSKSGINTISLKVIAEDKTEVIYTIEYVVEFSKNDSLDQLFVGTNDSFNLIDFIYDTKIYNLDINFDFPENIIIQATPTSDEFGNQTSKTFMVIGTNNPVETNKVMVNVAAGNTLTVQIQVLSEYDSQNGIQNYNTYTVNIRRLQNNKAEITNIEVNSNLINILPNVYEYDYVISGDLSNDNIKNALIKINASPLSKIETTYLNFEANDPYYSRDYNIVINPTSGNYPININYAGIYKIKIKITAQDNITTNTYYLNIIREPSNNSSFNELLIKNNDVILKSLNSSSFIYDDTLNIYTTMDIITVPYEINKISLQGKIYRNAYFKLTDGLTVYFNNGTIPYNLNTGINEINITVVAENNEIETQYKVLVKREYNSNTPYYIEHYKQSFDGTYSLFEREELKGLPFTIVNATEKTYQGFTFKNDISGTITNGEITEDGSLVLRLFYLRNNYSLTVNSNELSMGSVSGDSGNIKYDYNVSVVATPIKGYKFIGWYKDDNLVSSMSSYTFKMPSNDIKLIAKFNIETYSINYVLNNGINNINNPSNYTILDLPINILDATRNGYIFGGWYKDKDFTGNAVTSIDVNSVENINLYARWIEITYSGYKIEHYKQAINGNYILFETENLSGETNKFVDATAKIYNGFTYNNGISISSGSISNDGSLILKLFYDRNKYDFNINTSDLLMGNISEVSGSYYFDEEISIEAYAKPGYKFIGWYNNEDLISNNINFSFNIPQQDYQLTAKFSIIEYSITYNLNEGINHLDNPVKFTVEDLPITLKNPSRIGYTFEGWYDNSSFSGSKITDIITISNITLYAKWVINTYNVNFQSNYEQSISSIIVNYNGFATEPNINRNGYILLGWYLDSELTKIWDFNNDRITDNVTLYASWKLIEYSINYNLNDGSFEDIYPTTYTILSEEISLVKPIRVGYKFRGWYKDSNYEGEEITSISESSFGNIELYAKYEMITFQIEVVIFGSGTVVPSIGSIIDNIITVNYGSTLKLTISPNAEFEFRKILIDGIESELTDIYTLENVTQDHVIEVTFEGIEPGILTLLPNSGYKTMVYEIDRTQDVNLFLNYYIGQTVSNIRSCFENSPNKIKFFNALGVELTDSSILGTGHVIKLYSDYSYTEVIDEIYVVLVGDINGDGNINAIDINDVFRHINLMSELTTSYQLMAADPEKTGKINAISINAIFRHINLIESLFI